MENKALFSVLIGLVILSGIVSLASQGSQNARFDDLQQKINNNKVPTAEEIASKIVIPTATASAELPDSSKLDQVYDKMFEADLTQAKAEELVLPEVSTSKAFKTLVMNVLNDNSIENQSVDVYSDITEIYFVNLLTDETSIIGEDGTVTIEFKVKFLNEGDSDLAGKAKMSITLDVTKLVPKDDYVDAEVADFDEANFEVLKFYD